MKLGTKTAIQYPIFDHSINKRIKIYSCSNIYPNKRVDLMAEGLTNLKSQFEWHHFGEYQKFQV